MRTGFYPPDSNECEKLISITLILTYSRSHQTNRQTKQGCKHARKRSSKSNGKKNEHIYNIQNFVVKKLKMSIILIIIMGICYGLMDGPTLIKKQWLFRRNPF